MLALDAYRAQLCPSCGRPLSVCTDPESDGKWQVPAPTRCHATTAVLIAREQNTNPQPGALLFHAERKG